MNNPTSGGKARELTSKTCPCGSKYIVERYPEGHCHIGRAYTALEQDLAKLKAQNSHVCPECGHDMVSMDASKYADHWNKKLKEKLDRTEAQNQRLREKTFLNERNALQDKLAIAREGLEKINQVDNETEEALQLECAEVARDTLEKIK